MQQTEKYKLNLIETSDTFSPNPLNENAQKIEAQLSAEAAARESAVSGLSSRITVLEGHKIATGIYPGTAGTNDPTIQFIPLPFTPRIVFVHAGSMSTLMIQELPASSCRIMDGGFQISDNFNRSGSRYSYFAIC